jgi:hypothetical protein
MFGIPNFTPSFHTDAVSLLSEIREGFSKLAGIEIDEILMVWDRNEDDWFYDCPVILKARGIQFEFLANKLDEFSLTIDRINLNEQLDWYGSSDLRLEWRKHPLTDKLGGRKIKEVGIIEYAFTTRVVAGHNMGSTDTNLLLAGAYIAFESTEIQIFNGLDDTRVGMMEPQSSVQKTMVQQVAAGNGTGCARPSPAL